MSDNGRRMVFLDAGVTCPECLKGEYPCDACFKQQIAELRGQSGVEPPDSTKTETVKTDAKAEELRGPSTSKSFQSGSQPVYLFMEASPSSEEKFPLGAQFEMKLDEVQFLGVNLSSAARETQDARKRFTIAIKQLEAKRLCFNGAISPSTGESAMEVPIIFKPVIPPNFSASYDNFQSPASTPTVPPVTTSVTPDVEKSIPPDFHTTQKFPITCPHCGGYIGSNLKKIDKATLENISLDHFLFRLGLDNLQDLFKKEEITLEVLADLGHEELKDIGISTYGQRHKLIKGVGKLVQCLPHYSSISSSISSSSSDE